MIINIVQLYMTKKHKSLVENPFSVYDEKIKNCLLERKLQHLQMTLQRCEAAA